MRSGVRLLVLIAVSGSFWLSAASAQDRETKVKADRVKIAEIGGWIYNDLSAATEIARAKNKPILVVFRCIPCEACQEFDDDVARRDARVRDLLDRFVCVRIVQCNDLDLTRFQHDFDQSFAITFLHADGTILGRFGTRSNHDDESQDISIEGLRETLQDVLALHAGYEAVRDTLKGKSVVTALFPTPLEYPSLKGKYKPGLSEAEGQVARSCVHCHQVGEAERRFFRDQALPIPDVVLFPYPNPTVIGMRMNPQRSATILEITPESPAAQSGLKTGDRLKRINKQPIVSTADIQWILHHAADTAELEAEVNRDGTRVQARIQLPAGWRRRGDLSWRATTWDLRRMALGGLKLAPLPGSERARLGLAPGKLALVAEHVGEFGDHAVVKAAGMRKGDVVVEFDGRDEAATETNLIAHAVQSHRPGDLVSLTFVREGKTQVVKIRQQ